MIELILLIVGIVYAVRRPKIRKLTVQEFPGVDAAKFSEWQKAELKAIDIFLWATWGAFIIKIVISIIIILSQVRLSETAAIGAIIIIMIAWLGGLTVAAFFGSKAKKLKTNIDGDSNHFFLKGWKMLKIGDTVEEMLSLIGNPTKKQRDEDGHDRWVYEKEKKGILSSTIYSHIVVISDNKVVEIIPDSDWEEAKRN